MHHMLSKGDLVALGDYSDASEYNNKSPRLYKVNHFVLPIFVLEVVAVGCVGALAYYLRSVPLKFGKKINHKILNSRYIKKQIHSTCSYNTFPLFLFGMVTAEQKWKNEL